jgi:hypothetical protein
MHHRGSRAVLAMASANIVFNSDLLNSLSWLPTVFRDTFFATGRAQAANNAGLRFGAGLILGFAVGGL